VLLLNRSRCDTISVLGVNGHLLTIISQVKSKQGKKIIIFVLHVVSNIVKPYQFECGFGPMRVCDVACVDVNDLLTVTYNPISACQNVICIDLLIL